MKRIFLRMFAAGALASLGVGLIEAQCPGGRCGVPQMGFPQFAQPQFAPQISFASPVAPAAAPKIEWRAIEGERDVRYAFVDGRQIGAYRLTHDLWMDFDPTTRQWSGERKVFGCLIPGQSVPPKGD